MKKVAIAADHAGYPLKKLVADMLKTEGWDVVDLGTHNEQRTDYPDFALAVGQAITRGDAPRGILLCGSGVGASIAANKIRGVRASICHDTYSAHQGVEHDDMNVLVLGARIIGQEPAFEIVRAFLGATYANKDPYKRRLEKVLEMERQM